MTPGIVAESDLAGNTQSEYVFFNGERVARRDFPSGSVAYYFSDHLKTASVITDSAGNIKSESDYYPWGGELDFLANDSNHYKFTGKERDSETGLDYFGARYYSNGLGRFITPDWAAKAAAVPYAEFSDPQSLNLYTYVRNVPTVSVDADGHQNAKCYLSCKAHEVSNFFKDQNKKAIQALATLTVTAVAAVYTTFHSDDNQNQAPPPPPPATPSKNGAESTPAPGPSQGDQQNQQNDKKAEQTEHGQERADQARAGDAHRDVGDANRVIREGTQYTDSETGNSVSVRGNRVVIRDQDGNIVTRFKNTRANTQQRIQSGRWVPKPKASE